MVRMLDTPRYLGAAAPYSARAPAISYPATHESVLGIKTIDPNAVAIFDLTWPGISNPNGQASVLVAAEFNLWRSGGGGIFNPITQPVLVIGVNPTNVDFAGDKPDTTLSGGEVVSGHTDFRDIAGGGQGTLAATLTVWKWKEEDYGLDCVLWWKDPATNSWKKIDPTFHQWRIPWVTLRKAGTSAISAPTAPWPPSARFRSI